MVCSYRSSCLGLPVALVDCQMKGCESRLHLVCQGGYVAMHDIELDRSERKICHECIASHRKVVNTFATNLLFRSVKLDLMHSHILPLTDVVQARFESLHLAINKSHW